MFKVKPEQLDCLLERAILKAKKDLLLPNDKVFKTKFKQTGNNEYVVDIKIQATIYTEEIAKSLIFMLKAALSAFIRANLCYANESLTFMRFTVVNTLGGDLKPVGDVFSSDKEAIESLM